MGGIGSMEESSLFLKICVFYVPGGPYHFSNHGYHDFNAACGESAMSEMCEPVHVLGKRGVIQVYAFHGHLARTTPTNFRLALDMDDFIAMEAALPSHPPLLLTLLLSFHSLTNSRLGPRIEIESISTHSLGMSTADNEKNGVPLGRGLRR